MDNTTAPESPAGDTAPVRPAISFVVEWENANRIGAERSLEMFARLAAQIRETGFDDYEIVLVSGDPMPDDLRHDIVAIDPEVIGRRIRMVTAHERNYYRQKMFGVAESRGRTVLFLDSDVIPEPGWLAGMLSGLADPKVKVLCGTTFLEPAENMAKLATALFWIYDPAPPSGRGPVPSQTFFVNNIAFRREVIEQYPFPGSEAMRGQCRKLKKILQAEGIEVWRQQDARVEHPAFGSIGELVERAWIDGGDVVIEEEERGTSRYTTFRRVFGTWRRRRRHARERLSHRYRAVGGGFARSAGATVLYWGLDLTLLASGLVAAARMPARSAEERRRRRAGHAETA